MENCVGRSMSLAWLLYVIQWINNGTLSSTGIDMNAKPSQKRYRVFMEVFHTAVRVISFMLRNLNLITTRCCMQDPYLVLTGPTRAVVMNDETIPVTIEAELKVRGTGDGSTDKCLIFAAAPLPSEVGSYLFELTNGNYSKLKIALGRIMACVEATIFVRVIRGTWPAGFRGQIAAHTSTINPEKVVLVEFVDGVPVSDGIVDQSRFVVSVEAFGELMVSYKAWRGDGVMEGKVAFKPEKKGRSYGTLKVGACVLEVIVAWSPIRPVCEEVVSMSEMGFV